MERNACRESNHAFVTHEGLVVLAIVCILAAILLPALTKAKSRAQRIRCVSYLKQISGSFRIWQGDHQGNYPMATALTNGGTMEWIEGGNAFRHFQVMSNELNTPKILACPSDRRTAATDFSRLNNSNLSYFVGLDAADAQPRMCLVGDRNITNGLAPERTVLQLPPDRPAGWTKTTHVKQGNVGLADGSVQSLSTSGLREVLKNTGDTTNRIALSE
jgi:competence protein ComGC